MLLNYIWIKDFKNIHNKGFKFSDHYHIDYDQDTGILDIEVNDRHIKNFFPGNISSVTAVIGANGAGKTNLFEYLKYTLASFQKGVSAIYDYESLIVFDKEVFYHNNLQISNMDDLKGEGFTFLNYKESLAHFMNDDRDVDQLDEPDKIYENAYIYYSSIFDMRYEYDPFGLVDVSSNSLIYQERQSNRYRFDENLNPYRPRISEVMAFEVAEVDRQLDFIAENLYAFPFSFSLPKSMTIRIEDKYNSYFIGQHEYLKENGLTEFDNIWPYYFNGNQGELDQSRSITLFREIFIYKLLVILQYDDPAIFKDITQVQFVGLIFENKSTVLEDIYADERAGQLKNLLESLDELLKKATLLKSERDRDLFTKYDTIEFPSTEDNSGLLVKFFLNYKIAVSGRDFLAFHWTGMSSGEVAMLNFYARLNFALKDYRISELKHFVIMLDEGETNLHPEWQISFLNDMIKFFNRKIAGKTVQVIISSHSPFLISNLPKTMINFLDRDDEGNCIVVDGLTDLKQTFGANVNTLYSDSFFMKHSLMGSFAKSKIDRLINVVNKERGFDEEFPNWEVVQIYVDFIGEPILKGMLQRQLNASTAVTSIEVDALKKQISSLEGRIRNLEGDNDTN